MPGVSLVLDQGLPRDAARQLREQGRECVHVGEIGLATASDTEILAFARAHGRVVVTLDADFHAILAVTGAGGPSVVRIRVEGLAAEAMARLVSETIERYGSALAAGSMITVKRRKTTCRMLTQSGPV